MSNDSQYGHGAIVFYVIMLMIDHLHGPNKVSLVSRAAYHMQKECVKPEMEIVT